MVKRTCLSREEKEIVRRVIKEKTLVSLMFLITNASLLFLHQQLNRAAELVGARCGLAVAAYAFEACNDVLILHASNKATYALQVAVAATVEFHFFQNSILARHLNVTRAGSVCCVGYCLHCFK